MPTAFDEDGWTPELEAELMSAFGLQDFEFTDMDAIDAQIAEFVKYLDSTPDAEG